MRSQMQVDDLGVGGHAPATSRANGPAVGEALESRILLLEQKLQSNTQACEDALAKQAKQQESYLADLQMQLKQHCVALFKEENDLRCDVNRVIQQQLDALRDHLNDHLVKKGQPIMSTIPEQDDQERVFRLEEALEREAAAREEANAKMLGTMQGLLLQQEQMLEGQALLEDRLRDYLEIPAPRAPPFAAHLEGGSTSRPSTPAFGVADRATAYPTLLRASARGGAASADGLRSRSKKVSAAISRG